jgi:hypothetical protein
MLDIPSISAIVVVAGVLVGVVYYMLDIRHQNKIRKTDLALRLYSIAQTSEFMDAMGKVGSLQVKYYQDYVKQSGSPLSGSPMPKAFATVASFYGLLGGLLYRKLIDIDLVYDNIGSSYPMTLYEKVKPIILGMRREIEPTALVEFEYLCDELKRKEPQLKKTLNEAFAKTSSHTS